MNIHTAAIYMNQGYRARRPNWQNYLLKDEYGDIKQTYMISIAKIVDGKLVHHTYELSDSMFELTIQDLLADDWEISEASNETTS